MVDQTGLAVATEPSSPDPKVRVAGASPERLAVLANEATAACGGCACIIEWRTPQGIGRIERPEEVRWRAALGAISQIVAWRAEHTRPGGAVVLAAEEIAAVAGQRLTGGTPVNAVSCTTTDAENAVVITLLAAHGYPLNQIEAVARLTAHAALAIVAAEEAAASRDFWRDRASPLSEEISRLKHTIEADATQQAAHQQQIATSAQLQVEEREAENVRLHELVRQLGLRLYGAIDGERLRIARDLHDGQAQLLAAARITLAADPAKARGMLKQLDEALRSLVRDLRPTTLGRATLATVLNYKINRLREAGITGRIRHLERTRTLPRSLQQLCYQVVREAVSNVIRHAGASRAELSFERREGWVRLQIDDDGIRIDQPNANGATAPNSRGLGLAGMTERLALMGGTLKLERCDGITRLIAEIPTA